MKWWVAFVLFLLIFTIAIIGFLAGIFFYAPNKPFALIVSYIAILGLIYILDMPWRSTNLVRFGNWAFVALIVWVIVSLPIILESGGK